jgi:hypothetical protein
MQSKVAKSLFLLNRSKNLLPHKALKLLDFSLVHCQFTYCPLIYSICSKTQIKKLVTLQKKAIPLISGLGPRDHTALLFLYHDVLPVELKILLYSLCIRSSTVIVQNHFMMSLS